MNKVQIDSAVDILVQYLHLFFLSIVLDELTSLTVSNAVYVVVVHGCRDLFWLPVEQYRRDGRIVRGFQRGAQSFMTCTAMSTLELTNRVVQTIQVSAGFLYSCLLL